MCSGVGKSGSPRLKSKTLTPSAFICLALAPAASVADGWTAAAIFESASMVRLLPGVEVGFQEHSTERGTGRGSRTTTVGQRRSLEADGEQPGRRRVVPATAR